MVSRIVVTAIVVLLAIGAFWGDALGAGHVLNPFGILILALSGLVWFGWTPFREAFLAAKDESDIPIIRPGSTIIGGMESLKHPAPSRRSSSD